MPFWKDKSKLETARLDAIFERLNVDIDSLTTSRPLWWKKWKPEIKEAIELAIKNNKKGYLPLFYISTLEDCAGNNDCMCTTANKIIESAKVANDSKLPILFIAYTGLLYSQCNSNIKEEEIISEFNKMKRTLKDNPKDNEFLRQTNQQLGELYSVKEKYPQALVYLFGKQTFIRKIEDNRLYLCPKQTESLANWSRNRMLRSRKIH